MIEILNLYDLYNDNTLTGGASYFINNTSSLVNLAKNRKGIDIYVLIFFFCIGIIYVSLSIKLNKSIPDNKNKKKREALGYLILTYGIVLIVLSFIYVIFTRNKIMALEKIYSN